MFFEMLEEVVHAACNGARDEVKKGVRGMPRLSKETKDVESCEKPRGVAIEL